MCVCIKCGLLTIKERESEVKERGRERRREREREKERERGGRPRLRPTNIKNVTRNKIGRKKNETKKLKRDNYSQELTV